MNSRTYLSAACLLLLIFTGNSALAQGSHLWINEVMSSNLSSIQDEYEPGLDNCRVKDCASYYITLSQKPFATYDGDYPDWIELFNPGDAPVSLSGYGISDNPSVPEKWVFPAYTIPAHGYFIVLATGKDRKPADLSGGPFPHTNFKLSAKGGMVVLTDPAGGQVDTMQFSALAPDFTFGRTPDGAGSLAVFNIPTPGTANVCPPFPGFFDDPIAISPQGGFQAGSVTVSITSRNPDAEIYYTVTGDDPSPKMLRYAGPFTLSASAAVRARAFRNGIPSGIAVTQSYFVNYSTNLPVVSVTTAPGNLWDQDLGIYVEGRNGAEHYSNLWKDWERPCHVELYEADGTLGFSQDAGVQLFGRASKFNARKGLALRARDKYGKETFDYPLIPGLPIDQFHTFVLRASGDDWQGSLIRDILCNQLVNTLNIDNEHGRAAVVFLNGQYWGIHFIQEKLDEDYLASHHNIDPDNIDFMELYHGYGLVPPPIGLKGTEDNYNAMISFLETHDIQDSAVYAQVKNIIDIDSYLDVHAAGVYYANTDWMGNNYKCWRDRGPDGKWRFLMYDLDFAFGGVGDYKQDMIKWLTNPTGPRTNYLPWTTFIIRTLFKNEEFRNDFINRFADQCNTVFTPEQVFKKVEEFKAELAPEMPRHIARWNTTQLNSMQKWESELNEIRTFAKNRIPAAQQHIISYWRLGGKVSVVVSVSDSTGGDIRINTVVPEAYPWRGTYFQDVPIQVSAVPKPGFTFSGWDGLDKALRLDQSSSLLTITPVDTLLSLTAHFIPASDAMNSVVINEICYGNTSDSGDWVELYNGFDSPVDISGWKLRDDTDSRSFTMPVHTIMYPGGYLVIGEQPTAFRNAFPDVISSVGGFAFGFRPGGDTVRLFDANGNLVDDVAYQNNYPWPGNSLKTAVIGLRKPGLDNGDPENWAAFPSGGTPGKQNTFAAESDIVINEICYNSSAINLSGDWIELNNTGTRTVDLSGWTFRDKDDADVYAIPAHASIKPGGYLVLCRDGEQFMKAFPKVTAFRGDFPFGLDSQDALRLFDSEGTLVDWVEYGASAPWPSEPDGNGPTLALNDPSSDNSYYLEWSPSKNFGTPGADNNLQDISPQPFALGQNYPNPFNLTTVVPFELSEDSEVVLEIFNALGQRVATPVHGRMEAGSHTVSFDASGLPSGLLFYHLRAGKHEASGRMLLMK